MKNKSKYIMLIDDDDINNFLSREIISMHLSTVSIDSFTDPKDALQLLNEKLQQNQQLPDIILLDINMPLMDGWEFLRKIDQLEHRSKFNSNVYLYTSSVYNEDAVKAKEFPTVKKVFVKPLTKEAIQEILAD
ncbi:MAG: response regulator [Chitinophagaceae bacterium]|nr:response regulator [Chitinophagaceae bacterium]